VILEVALKFHEAFSSLELQGGNFVEELSKAKGSLTSNDFLPFLKLFFDTIL